MNPSWFLTAHAIKYNHTPTATPTSNVIAAVYNHFLPPLDDDNNNDTDTSNLMGKYDGRGKKKWKGGHHRRYRDDNEIEALHGLYEEPKDDEDDGSDDDNDNGDWNDME